MAYVYTTVDGQRVEISVAAAFKLMAEEFRRVWGLTLHVRSGTRTRDEQYRLWDGYRRGLPGFNLALHPDNPLAYHVETNPQGPRALDLYDSGSDAGVSVVGTRRNNWIRDNAPRWGFTLSGLTFNPKEGWHIHSTRPIGSTAGGSASTGFPARERYGAEWVVEAQRKLQRLGYSIGADGADGFDGANTQLAVKELQKVLGVEVDGIYGPKTNDGADVILAGRNAVPRSVAEIQRVVGAPIDNAWGPITSRHVYAWQRAQGLQADAIWGEISDAKAFPAAPGGGGAYPENGRNITSRPTVEIQRFLIGRKLLEDGGADGAYGPKTSVAVARYQESEKLDVDGIWGNATDARAFPGSPPPADTFVVSRRTPIFPGAAEGWNVPLGQSPRDPGSIITTYFIHHEAGLGSDAEMFKQRNSRGSCPTWEVEGPIAREFIHPGMRPSATGLGNTYSVASETVNVSLAPDWKVAEESFETHARIAAWLSQQQLIVAPDGSIWEVDVKLDRQHIKGHWEAPGAATECPGPHVRANLDRIIERARQIVAEQQPNPVPEPEPEPVTITVPANVAAEILATSGKLHAQLTTALRSG